MSRRRRRIVRVIGPGSSLGGGGASGQHLLLESGSHLRLQDNELLELGSDPIPVTRYYVRLGPVGVTAMRLGTQ